MWAKIEDASITGLIPRPKSLTIGDVQYPHNIFGLWSVSELEAIGIYEVTIDYTNLKDTDYYNNTDITYAFSSGAATGSYGTATAKVLTDVLYTATDESNGLGTEGELKTRGLKTSHKQRINREAYSSLQDSDWLVIRAAEGGTAVTSAWTTYRAAVRTKSNDMETLIDAAANVDALAALYVYNEDDPPTRPLGEWPSKPS
jgi:hypothetical protein